MFYVQNIYELRIFVANDCENSAALCSTGLLMIPDDGLAVDNVLWQVELINHAQGNGPTAWLAVVHFPFDEESLHSILDSWSDRLVAVTRSTLEIVVSPVFLAYQEQTSHHNSESLHVRLILHHGPEMYRI